MVNKQNWYYILQISEPIIIDGYWIIDTSDIPIKTTKYYNDNEWKELGLEAYRRGFIDEHDLKFVNKLELITKKEYKEIINN